MIKSGESDQELIVAFDCCVDPRELSERFEEALSLAASILDTEFYLRTNFDQLTINRRKAILAIYMLQDFHTDKAVEVSKDALALATGEITATSLGFPEFEDNAIDGVFD